MVYVMIRLFFRKSKSAIKRFVQNIDSAIGTKLLGNYGGYFFDKKKYSKLDETSRSGPILKYGTYRGSCDPKHYHILDTIASKTEELLSLNEVEEGLSRSELKEKIRAKQVLVNLDKHIPNLFSLITPEAKQAAESFFGKPFSVYESALIRTFHVKESISSMHETIADRYHLDVNDDILLNMFIAIEDITEHHGPFTFYDKNKSEYLIKNHFKHRNTSVKVYEKLEVPEQFIAKKGDWFFFDGAHVFHRASIPKKGNVRTVVQMLLRPEV